ncbi:MmcQ/YjbR family DNA-binding protein [uncultured Desulfovibrio sp.]|uniref:MmcQ/YjbR family DNA-binding protein n=1 Tax=uncultured Desulfovibrio sp. TaxID=167968 RepID=UPI003207D972
MTNRESLLAHVRETYGVTPDFPWLRSPRYAVLRHAGNGKWFGLIMDLPGSVCICRGRASWMSST